MPKEVFVGSEGAAWQTLEKDYYNYPLSGYCKTLRAKKKKTRTLGFRGVLHYSLHIPMCTLWPLVLWPLPEDFEKLAYPENFFVKFVVFELATMSCKMSLLFFLRKLNYIYLPTHTK